MPKLARSVRKQQKELILRPDMPPPTALVAQLREQGLFACADRFEPLYGGRTNRVWKLSGQQNDRVLKLYRTGFENPLFRNDPDLEAMCLRAFEHAGFAPRLLATGQVGQERWVLYDHAPGTPWRRDPESAAQVLRRVHVSRVNIPAPRGCNGSEDLERHGEKILDLCDAADRDALNACRPRGSISPADDCRLIHGDPVAGNILISGGQATLIDWQCPAIGDPCEDLALFLSPAMQRIYRGSPLDAAEARRFLAAYDAPEIVARYRLLRPWYVWRMAAYCLWRSRNGAPDYADGFTLELETLTRA